MATSAFFPLIFLSKRFILMSLVPIAIFYPYLTTILILYYLFIVLFNKQLLSTNSYSIFILRCIFKLVCFYMIFLSGWVYVSSFDSFIFILKYDILIYKYYNMA